MDLSPGVAVQVPQKKLTATRPSRSGLGLSRLRERCCQTLNP
ncbi:hypothetical protein ACFPRL_20195 [Pseudoclavibacter helvolus]